MQFNEKWESKCMFMCSRDRQKSSLYQGSGSGKNLQTYFDTKCGAKYAH